MAADTFHLFPRLPAELRIQIWSMTASRRMLRIKHRDYCCSRHSGVNRRVMCLSRDPTPAVLHACSESRQHAPYKKAFVTATDSGTRYVWANFDTDIVFLDGDALDHEWPQFESLEPHTAEIQRLRFSLPIADERMNTHDDIIYDAHEFYGGLTALRELQIDIPDSFGDWSENIWGAYGQARYPEGVQVRFLDLVTGHIFTMGQLMVLKMWEYGEGGKIWNVQFVDRESMQWASGSGDRWPFPADDFNPKALKELD